jgi:hypothetical protein
LQTLIGLLTCSYNIATTTVGSLGSLPRTASQRRGLAIVASYKTFTRRSIRPAALTAAQLPHNEASGC